MLRLLLLRHAEATPAACGGDLNRELTPAGEEAARRTGVFMNTSPFFPELALVSPAKRATRTFELLCEGAGRAAPRVIAPALYDASASTALALLQTVPSLVKRLLVVGHNPSLAEAAVTLARFGAAADLTLLRKQFPAPALAAIDIEADDWRAVGQAPSRLEFFLTLVSKELQGGP
ncbi:histidine phosphatase family protein [Methylocella sp.]|uniref:SixA phosphatase family protein n=1 Tax=Methylocella sp. TaxID=1978226 RepID=UPI0035AE29F7